MNARRVVIGLVVPLLGMLCPQTAGQGIPCSYEVAYVIQAPPCPITGPPATSAVAISPDGRYVCGRYAQCATGDSEAFVFDALTQEFFTIPRPPGVYSSSAADVNDAGMAVGAYWRAGEGQRGWMYHFPTRQYVVELQPLPAGSWCAATGINSSNAVCGVRSIGSKGDPVNPMQAFVFTPGQGIVDLGVMTGPSSGAEDIADNGTVVGWTGAGFSANAARAFVRSDSGRLTVLPFVPNGFSSAAAAVNCDGGVAIYGRMSFFPGNPRAFIHRENAFTDLGILPGFDIAVVANIGDSAEVVGTLRRFSPNLSRGFLWCNGFMRDLETLVPAVPPLEITGATAISTSGHIVAGGQDSVGDVVSFVLIPDVVVGDVFPDCRVDINDLLTIIQWWGPGGSQGDVNGDGIVDIEDLVIVIENWTS